MRVISATGEQLGIMSAVEALRIAEDENLDLVKISPNAVPPVCKIMNYGKFKFEQAKKEKENRKNQKVIELKEIYLSMTIDIGDLKVKSEKDGRAFGRRKQGQGIYPYARTSTSARIYGCGRNASVFRYARR